MRRRHIVGIVAAGASLVAAMALVAPRAGAEPFGFDDLTTIQKGKVSGLLAETLGSSDAAAQRRAAGVASADHATDPACGPERRGDNIRVNQNCQNDADADLHGRGQAANETWVAVNPKDPDQLIAGYNDYRRGDGTCGISYSTDGGKRWADATAPNGFVRGTAYGNKPRQYFQSSGDPGIAWDSRGNAYYSCLEFKRGITISPDADQSNGIYVYRSTGTAGASWNFAGHPVVEHNDVAGAGDHLEDKEFIAADANASSPFRDRIYVTWTRFAADGTAYILSSHSADYGQTFSAPVLVSSDSALCDEPRGVPTPQGRCTINQFSEPVVAPDGTLHVAWANSNTSNPAGGNRLQILAAKSTDGGVTFSAPVKVGDYHELPDCDTYQGAGKNPDRACVVEKGASTNSIFRAANYPMLAVDPKDPQKIAVTYGSYINRNSNEGKGCTPAGLTPALNGLYTGVKNGGCNNDIVTSTSANGGATFTGGATNVRNMPVVTDGSRQDTTDQYWQGTVFSPKGNLVTAYYDRQYGNANATGFSDVTLTASRGTEHRRVTSSSMPPTTQFNGQFFGDYMMVAATATKAYPLWMDTRADALFLCPGTGVPNVPPELCTGAPPGPQTLQRANDQEIFISAVPIS
jgi:hypothetical protein